MTWLSPFMSLSLTMWKPEGVRSGCVMSPFFIVAITSPMNVGSSEPLRSPSAPPSSAVCAFE
jgi:hypothetical protein